MAANVTLAAGESVTVIGPPGGSLTTTSAAGAIVVTASSIPTPPPDPTPLPITRGVLISPTEVMALPMAGAAWTRLVAGATKSISLTGMLSDQDSSANVTTLAAALVAVRKGDGTMRAKVVTALKALHGQSLGRALALSRELGAYVIAADLIGATDAEVGYDQRAFYLGLLTKTTSGGPASLMESVKDRPNNWGTHAQGAIACVLSKYGSAALLDELYRIVQGWAGNRAAYSGFTYGDKSWQADPTKPVGVNPKGAVKSGKNIDGVLPDDMRRGGSFPTVGADGVSYTWEALQGALLAALVLERTGRAVASIQQEALYRAYRWIVDSGHPAGGDDTWQPWAWLKLYPAHKGTISLPSSASPGKNLGWTDWLYG